jgi:hypothetical protein
MPRTWLNEPCRFETENTANVNGNSVYTVWSTGLYRDALVNLDRQRDPGQVLNYSPGRCICYTDDDALADAILDAVWGRPPGTVEIVDVYNLNTILIHVQYHNTDYSGYASRQPQVGYTVIDAVNQNGVLDEVHVGHAVHRMLQGNPLQGTFDERLQQLRGAIDRYRQAPAHA